MRNQLLLALSLIATACTAADVSQDDSQVSADELRSGKILQAMDVTRVVSDTAGASHADASLKNAWGIAFNPSNGAAWVSSAGSGKSVVYDASGKLLLSVAMPSGDGPTAQIFNAGTGFRGDKFITVSESGNVMGWKSGTTATVRAHSSTANYKGAAIAGDKLYAANFKTGRVDMFDTNYQLQACSGGFVDSALPQGFAPFNVWEYEGYLFVSYAKPDADAHDDVKGAGNGLINVFDTDGNLKQRLVTRGPLNSPWGMAITEEKVGNIAKETLLVGNFGDGKINAFELSDATGGGFHGKFKGALGNAAGKALVIDGLWGLANDASHALWFTAGPNEEANGLVGRLSVHVATPASNGGGY